MKTLSVTVHLRSGKHIPTIMLEDKYTSIVDDLTEEGWGDKHLKIITGEGGVQHTYEPVFLRDILFLERIHTSM